MRNDYLKMYVCMLIQGTLFKLNTYNSYNTYTPYMNEVFSYSTQIMWFKFNK